MEDIRRITSFKQVEALIASDYPEDEKVEAAFMTQIDCDVCGAIWKSSAVFTATGERGQNSEGEEGTLGSMLLPEGERFFLVDDARVFLRLHIDEAHPGWRFVIDGDDRQLRARRCGRRHRR